LCPRIKLDKSHGKTHGKQEEVVVVVVVAEVRLVGGDSQGPIKTGPLNGHRCDVIGPMDGLIPGLQGQGQKALLH